MVILIYFYVRLLALSHVRCRRRHMTNSFSRSTSRQTLGIRPRPLVGPSDLPARASALDIPAPPPRRCIAVNPRMSVRRHGGHQDGNLRQKCAEKAEQSAGEGKRQRQRLHEEKDEEEVMMQQRRRRMRRRWWTDTDVLAGRERFPTSNVDVFRLRYQWRRRWAKGTTSNASPKARCHLLINWLNTYGDVTPHERSVFSRDNVTRDSFSYIVYRQYLWTYPCIFISSVYLCVFFRSVLILPYRDCDIQHVPEEITFLFNETFFFMWWNK